MSKAWAIVQVCLLGVAYFVVLAIAAVVTARLT
jgi:hypothetical protein